ncbi:MAG TPA: hypothetical protein VKR58_08485 [Aquella sp.]|nr:hypothetical protein [Aquella sp.]
MINIVNFIKENQKLINRFIDLSMCRDRIFDSRRRWFYSLISRDILLSIQHLICEDDLRQDIYLRIIELAKNSNNDRALKQYLQKDIGWYLRDKLNGLVQPEIVYQAEDYDYINESKLDILDLHNILSSQDNIYGKYLLFLFTKKCYTINQISEILYQDRSTIRKHIKKEIDTWQKQSV